METTIDIQDLAHIGLRVADAEASGRFYRLFGFQWSRRDVHENVHVLRHAAGIELNLIERAERRASNVLLDENPRAPGYTHVALHVRDVRQTAVRLAQADIRITEGPVRFGDGSTSIFVRDPDGNVVELSQPAEAAIP